jgi:hypothetical protein
MDHRYNSLPFFNSEFKFLLINESNFHVTGFSYGPTTRDAMGRVSCSRVASDVATIATSRWILATTTFRWILPTTASSWPSRPEFQHSFPTIWPRILSAAAVGTSSWRASLVVGNASVDDTNAAAVATFFFATDGKSFMPTFNCSIRNTSKCRTSRLLVHLCLQTFFFIDRHDFIDGVLNMGGFGEGEGMAQATTRRHRDRVVLYLCRKTMIMYCC